MGGMENSSNFSLSWAELPPAQLSEQAGRYEISFAGMLGRLDLSTKMPRGSETVNPSGQGTSFRQCLVQKITGRLVAPALHKLSRWRTVVLARGYVEEAQLCFRAAAAERLPSTAKANVDRRSHASISWPKNH